MKNNLHFKTSILILLIALISFSCQEENIEPLSNSDLTPTELGKKIENPYTLGVMDEALDVLFDDLYFNGNARVSGIKAEEIDIRVTHRYIRILPTNFDESKRLTSDTTMIYSEIPMDYEVEIEGDFYHDPSLPDSVPTYLYTVIPVDFEVEDSLNYEVISDMYFPSVDIEDEMIEGDTMTVEEVRENKDMMLTILEHEAYQITENEDGIVEYVDSSNVATSNGKMMWSIRRWVAPKKWEAKGTVKVYNTETKRYDPVIKAKVICKRLFKWYYRETNKDGYVNFGKKFRHHADYIIKFKNASYSIKEGWLNQAELRLKNKKRAFSFNLKGPDSEDKNWLHATMHNAAYYYYYEYTDHFSITRPRHVSIKTKKGDNGSDYMWGRGIFGSEIKFSIQKNGYRDTKSVYATMFHELAHAGHYKLEAGIFGLDDYHFGEGNFPIGRNIDEKTIMRESWALGVEVELMNFHFRKITGNSSWTHKNNLQYSLYQNGGDRAKEGYTSLVRDLIDTTNQARTDDRVDGYTLEEIEDALDRSRKFGDWESRLKDISNSTSNFVDELFSSFD